MQARKCLVLCLLSVVSATWIFPGQRRCSATSSSCGTTTTTTTNRKRHSRVSVYHKGNLDNDRFFPSNIQRSDSANRLTPSNRETLNLRRDADGNTYGLKIPTAVSSKSPFRTRYISSTTSAPRKYLRPSIYRSERRAYRPSLYLFQSDPSQRDTTIPLYDNVPVTTTPKPFLDTYAHVTSLRHEYPSPRPFPTSSPYKYVTPTPRYQAQSLRYSPGRQLIYKKSVTTTSPYREPKGGSYVYRYDVNSLHHGASFRHQEHSNGETVHGEYRVRLPDGRLQIVSYTADHKNGFVPSIRYEGSQINQAANIYFQTPHRLGMATV